MKIPFSPLQLLAAFSAAALLGGGCGSGGQGGDPTGQSGPDTYTDKPSGTGSKDSPTLTPVDPFRASGPGNDIAPTTGTGASPGGLPGGQGQGGTGGSSSGLGGSNGQGGKGGSNGQGPGGTGGTNGQGMGGTNGAQCETTCTATFSMCPDAGVNPASCGEICKTVSATCQACVAAAGTDCKTVAQCVATLCQGGGPGGSGGTGGTGGSGGTGGTGGSGGTGGTQGGSCESGCASFSAMCPAQLPSNQCGAFCSSTSAACQACVFSNGSNCAGAQEACTATCTSSGQGGSGGAGGSSSGGGCAALTACCVNPSFVSICKMYTDMGNDATCDAAAKSFCMLAD